MAKSRKQKLALVLVTPEDAAAALRFLNGKQWGRHSAARIVPLLLKVVRAYLIG